MLATGASSIKDVSLAVKKIEKLKKQYVLMQCNTNYTNSLSNFKYINLNALKTYKKKLTEKLKKLTFRSQ